LIKLVLDEQGSDSALELWSSSAHAASSLLAYPEGRAALTAARRDGRLDQRLYRESQKSFDRTPEELVMIGVDQQLTHTAGDLASVFPSATTTPSTWLPRLTWPSTMSPSSAGIGISVGLQPPQDLRVLDE